MTNIWGENLSQGTFGEKNGIGMNSCSKGMTSNG
jgi:hypothetical protein